MLANSKRIGVDDKMKSAEVDIVEISDWFLSKDGLTHKKLQKLCYYAVAWGWALMNRPIAKNSEFQAWVHGPVSPLLYEKYKENGWNTLPRPKTSATLPEDVVQLLESVWATYGDKGGNELEVLSHIELPWRNARIGVKEDERSTNVVDVDDMRRYYKSIYQGDDQAV